MTEDTAATAAQYGPHRWSAGYHDDGSNDAFRGRRFTVADLTGARFVDCDLTGIKIVDSWLVGVDVSGFVQQFVINGVDVTEYVETELDRRHPERVQLREIGSIADFRAMWDTIDGLWSDATSRALAVPEAALHDRVDEEWSFVETLRHLVFITDSWLSRTILDQERPFHPLGLPQTAYAPADAASLGIDLDADPSLAEVLSVRAERMDLVRATLDTLDNPDLGRACLRSPAPGYPEEPRPVAECLAVVMEEECDHLRYATRDLARLENLDVIETESGLPPGTRFVLARDGSWTVRSGA